jgi:hypothetical protein
MFTFATPFFYKGLGSGIRDPGSGMNKYPDLGSGIKHPGSATLVPTLQWLLMTDFSVRFLFYLCSFFIIIDFRLIQDGKETA